MAQTRSIGYLVVIILVVIAPSALSLGWYQLSKNPSLRPLAITKQALAAYDGIDGGGTEVIAYIDWVPPRTGNYSQTHLAKALVDSFAAKGASVRVEIREGLGETRVTFRVGPTMLGPYATSRASEGINAAVDAFKMERAAVRRADE